MTLSTLLSPLNLNSFSFKTKTHDLNPLFSLKIQSFILKSNPRRNPISTKAKSAAAPDRLYSAICYFYPFLDGLKYGKHVISQFPPIQMSIQPLVTSTRVFENLPDDGWYRSLVFLTIYFMIVKNPKLRRYVRFNTMQAIMLDLLLTFPDLLKWCLNSSDGFGLYLVKSFDSTVFLFLLVCLIYGTSTCLIGQVPRLPIVWEIAQKDVIETN